MKVASHLIRLGSKRLGKDVTMPLENAKKVSIVTKQLSNSLLQASGARKKTLVHDANLSYDMTTAKSLS